MPADIVVIANKWWEAAPLLGVLRHSAACPASFADLAELSPGSLATPTSCDPAPPPRLRLRVQKATVSVWCLQDLMNPSVNGSSTAEKARVLPKVFAWEGGTPRLVIAFGTAADPQKLSRNGTVAVGSSVFIHNPYAGKPEPAQQWSPPHPDQVVTSPSASLLEGLDLSWMPQVTQRTLTPPNAGAPRPGALVDNDLVSVGVVNVTNYADYDWTDQQALDAFAAAAPGATAGSLETTHGVIRSASDAPFLYVSGYVNGVGQFQQQTAANSYSQNFVGAHNAGVALAWLLDALEQRM
jgi:hypothetical protein